MHLLGRLRSRPCRCGHPREAHEHYTVPGDLRCGLCECGKFRRGRGRPTCT